MKDSPKRKTDNGDIGGWSIFKRRVVRWGLVALAIILLPYLFFRLTSGNRNLIRCDYPEIAIADRESEDKTLSTFRIATWNIAHGRGSGDSNWKQGGDEKRKRVDQIAEKIRAFDADVVVLNEVDFCASWSGGNDQAHQIAKKAGYQVCIKQANLDFGFLLGRWYFGNAILSRFPVSDARIVDLEPLKEWESWLVGKKRGVSCTINLPNGKDISVVGLHLESRGEAIRVEQVDDVAQHIGELSQPIIVIGDLNTTPSDFPNAQRNGDGINAFDRFIEQTQFAYQPDTIEGSAELNSDVMTYSTLQPKLVIDWILLSHELGIVDQQIIDTQLSDHRPVIATIEFKEFLRQ